MTTDFEPQGDGMLKLSRFTAPKEQTVTQIPVQQFNPLTRFSRHVSVEHSLCQSCGFRFLNMTCRLFNAQDPCSDVTKTAS